MTDEDEEFNRIEREATMRKPKLEDDDDIQDYVRPWVGLTDEEIEMYYACILKVRKKDLMPGDQKVFAKTIELALRKKNT